MFFLIKLLLLPLWLPLKIIWEAVEHSGGHKRYRRRGRSNSTAGGFLALAVAALFVLCWPLTIDERVDGSPSTLGWALFAGWLALIATVAGLIARRRANRSPPQAGVGDAPEMPAPDSTAFPAAAETLGSGAPAPGAVVLTCHECGSRNYTLGDTSGELPNQRMYCPKCTRHQPHHVF